MVHKKHMIILNIEENAKDGLLKEKEIKSLKKKLASQRRLNRELESAKEPIEEHWNVKPLKEGMMEIKQEVMDEVLVVVRQFIEALNKILSEEDQSKYIIIERVRLHKILDTCKPMILKKEVIMINDRACSCIEQMDLQVQLLEENTTIWEVDEVVVEVKHLLHSLMMIEDVNSYQSEIHLRRIL